MAKDKNILEFPLFYRIVPLVLFGFSAVGSICILLFRFEEWSFIIIIMGFFGLPSLIMFILWSLWRVDIKDNGFIYRNYFGRKKEYKYEDLEYKMHPKGLIRNFRKDGKKVLRMAYYIENGDRLDTLYHQYIKKHKKK